MELMGTCTEKELIKRDYAGFPEAIISKINFSVIEALNYLKEEHVGCSIKYEKHFTSSKFSVPHASVSRVARVRVLCIFVGGF